jgi:hypothetical protein
MKKKAKITLIVVPIVLILIGSSFGVTLLYSKNNVTYEIGEPTIVGYISDIIIAIPPFIDYTGYILVDTPLQITNGGIYDIEELSISVQVYGQGFALTLLNEAILGQGTNPIGNILHGNSWSGNLQLNMTTSIALLAIWSGELRIELQISLKLNFLLFKAPLIFAETQIEPWTAPF